MVTCNKYKKMGAYRLAWKKSPWIVTSLLSSFFMGSPVSAEASVDYFELSPEQLLTAEVVSVTKTSQSVLQSPAAIYVLSNEDIVRSGATSIPETLRMVPGVQVARINTHSWAISVRGFNQALSNKLLVLIDGRTVYNPLFSGTYWDVQDTIMEDIERIEVIRGPGAALWGANAVNGVINVITKAAADTQGGFASISARNKLRGSAQLRYGGKMGDNGHYRVYGKGFDRGQQKAIGGGDANDGWRSERGGFRADWQENPADSFTVQGDIYQSQTESINSSPILISPFRLTEEETVQSKGGNILGHWVRQLGEDSRLDTKAYIDYTSRDQILLKDERLSLDIDTQYELPQQDRHKWVVGGRYRYSMDDLQGDDTVAFTPGSRSDNLFSTFFQDQITLYPEEWYLTLGSKFEYNEYSGFEVQPNARLSWQPDKHQTWWTSVSRAVRTPSRLEHDINIDLAVLPGAVPTLGFLQGNRAFKSEELIAYELGYRNQLSQEVTFDAATFYNDYSNLTTAATLPGFLVPATGTDPAFFALPIVATNMGEAETYGGELTLGWTPAPNLKFGASYSYLDMQLHAPTLLGGSQENAEGQSPENQFNVHSMWNMTDDLSWDTFAYYVDRLPTYQVEDYLRLDMRLGWRINEQIQFHLIGQNLLDNAHQEFSSATTATAAEIQRSFFAKVTWQF